jgi:hypothetical protein
MFTISHSDGSFIKKIFTIAISPLEVVPLNVSTDGINILGISPDKMILIKITVPSLVFEEFNLSSEAKLFLEKEDLKLAVKKISKRERVRIEYNEGDRDLKMTIFNPKTGVEKIQMIHIREEGEEPPGEIDIDLETEIQMTSDSLISLVRDVATVSDEMELSIQKSKLKIRSVGDLMRYDTTLEEGRGVMSISSKSEAVVSKYSIDLLKTVIKGIPKNTVITIGFGPSKPMKIYLPLEGGAGATFWIAPRA